MAKPAANLNTSSEDYVSENKEEYSNDNSKMKFPVQVFVRIRPLINEEIDNHKEIEYRTKDIKKTKSTAIHITDITARRTNNVRRSVIPKKNKKPDKAPAKKLKKFHGFQSVIHAKSDNFECFKQCILPSIDNIFNGNTVCSFAYGHTQSGKTHTIIGYHPQTSPGMYRLTAIYIADKLRELNKSIPNEENQMQISCRFAELYKGKLRDLFGNLVECHIREDDNGNINIRGPTLKDEETKQVKVSPLTPVYAGAGDIDKLILKVTESLEFRKQRSSGVDDESSRSHIFLEMELVTKQLIKARETLWNAEAAVVPVGKERDDMLMKMRPQYELVDPATMKYRAIPEWKPDPNELQRLETEFARLNNIVKRCEKNIERIMKESNDSIGGTVVFVDLAGNEYESGSDNKNIGGVNKIQMSERKEINKSLLSLKECVRALHNKKGYIPFRNSKLTMALRPHLKGINSTVIMIANISLSQHHVHKTYNTLLYAQLVAKALK